MISSKTFFTILRFDKWYFAPDGVLKTVCAFTLAVIQAVKRKQNQYDKSFKDELQSTLHDILRNKLQVQISNEKQNKKRITDLKGLIEKPEERFVLSEITKEQYQKISGVGLFFLKEGSCVVSI